MGRGDGVNERLLENENNRLSDQLAGKISKLKQISIEMKVRSFPILHQTHIMNRFLCGLYFYAVYQHESYYMIYKVYRII